MSFIRFVALWLLFLTSPIFAGVKFPKADRIAAPATPEQIALIREGVVLHDKGDYQAAIVKYKQVLAENPWEVTALHELAFSYFASKSYQQTLETAMLGAQCRSKSLPVFYMLIGNALDELGRREDAMEVYKAAIQKHPRVGLLHYNLGISLHRVGKHAEAKAAIAKGLQCDPTHASSHLMLGSIYRDMGYRIPAILALSRFLALEPESPRAAQTVPILRDLLTQGVTKNGENNININISAPPKSASDEGDFMGVEMMIGIELAGNLMVKTQGKEKTEASLYERLVTLYTMIGESLKNSKPKGGFAAKYYAPYFAALTEAGHTEAFVAQSWKTGNVDGAAGWISANPAKLEAFRAWAETFRWPEK